MDKEKMDLILEATAKGIDIEKTFLSFHKGLATIFESLDKELLKKNYNFVEALIEVEESRNETREATDEQI